MQKCHQSKDFLSRTVLFEWNKLHTNCVYFKKFGWTRSQSKCFPQTPAPAKKKLAPALQYCYRCLLGEFRSQCRLYPTQRDGSGGTSKVGHESWHVPVSQSATFLSMNTMNRLQIVVFVWQSGWGLPAGHELRLPDDGEELSNVLNLSSLCGSPAGGCLLAMSCDYRMMVRNSAMF